MFSFARTFARFTGIPISPRVRFFAVLVAVAVALVVSGVVFHRCTTRGLENEVKREREARSQESQIRIDDAKHDVSESANSSARALENVGKTENADFGNTNLSEAQRLRCRAFPERCR